MGGTRGRAQAARARAAGLAALLLVIPGLASAAVSEVPSVQALAAGADLAVHATVGSIWPAWNETGDLIVSYVTLLPIEVLRGDLPPAAVVVRVAGGVMPEENLGMRVSGAAEFQVGEEVVLLLRRPVEAGLARAGATAPFYRVAGGEHGKFAIRRDPRTGAKQAVRPLGAVVGQAPGSEEAMSLERLRELIRGAPGPGPR
jgi:hypothetical protein